MKNRQPISLDAEGVDVESLINKITETVAKRRAQGDYDDSRIALAERHNLQNLKDDPAFLERYLECMKPLAHVDISDFEIIEKRVRFSGPLVRLKKTIWSLLRFYTFRLWSQQNQVNGILLSAIELLHSRYKRRIESLEERIAKLEAASEKKDA